MHQFFLTSLYGASKELYHSCWNKF